MSPFTVLSETQIASQNNILIYVVFQHKVFFYVLIYGLSPDMQTVTQ